MLPFDIHVFYVPILDVIEFDLTRYSRNKFEKATNNLSKVIWKGKVPSLALACGPIDRKSIDNGWSKSDFRNQFRFF